MPETIYGTEIAGTAISRSQVYKATHNGDKRLSYMNRSFISFSYGGKWIEDFDLIAITNGDRLSHPLYSEFTDIVKDPEVYDGQHYWSTHFKANTWSLTLSTDGITENKLEEFKQWFAPGNIRELVLAEHPNRGILARVSRVPTYEVIPFEEKEQEVKIAGETYKTSTTIYKGNISLDFVMDDPFWYSLSNMLSYKEPMEYDGTTLFEQYKWYDVNNEPIRVIDDKDALKIILEDYVPTRVMMDYPNGTTVPMLFGYEDAIYTDLTTNTSGSLVDYATVEFGRVPYVLVPNSGGLDLMPVFYVNGKLTHDDTTDGYFFYGGTAPSRPIISFNLVPDIANLSDNYTARGQARKYISTPRNTYGTPTSVTDGKQYNYITIESTNAQEFAFTTPSVYTAYNQAVALIDDIEPNTPWEDIRVMIRDTIKHYAVRAYLNSVIDNIPNADTGIQQAARVYMMNKMPEFIGNFTLADEEDPESEKIWDFPAAIYEFDCATGQATAKIYYRTSVDGNLSMNEENVGDMVISDYLIIKERNNFSEDGYVKPRTNKNPSYSHRIYTNVKKLGDSPRLCNLTLKYKYRYY